MPSVRASGVSAIAHCNSDNLSELKHGSLIPALHKVGLPNDSYGKPLENHRKMMVKWIFMGCTLTYLVCKYTVTLHIWVFIYIYIWIHIYTYIHWKVFVFFRSEAPPLAPKRTRAFARPGPFQDWPRRKGKARRPASLKLTRTPSAPGDSMVLEGWSIDGGFIHLEHSDFP